MKAFYLRVALKAAIPVLEFSFASSEVSKLWGHVIDVLNQKIATDQWHYIEADLIEFVKKLHASNVEVVFSSYFAILEKSFLKPAKLRLWLLLGKAFASNDTTASQRFLTRYYSRIENIHGAELKIATCQVFIHFGNVLSGTLGKNSPTSELAHFFECKIAPKINQFVQKAKYHHIAYTALSSVVVLCSKAFFLNHLHSIAMVLQNLMQSRLVPPEEGLLSILQLIWVYLNRHTEAWATMGRNIEELCNNLFNTDIKKYNAKLLVEIITVIFLKMPRIALNTIIFQNLKDLKHDWEKCLILLMSLRNFLSLYCEAAARPNFYPSKDSLYFIESNDYLRSNFQVDLLGPYDSREFFDKFQKQLACILISLVDVTWNSSIIDPKEDSPYKLDKTQVDLVALMLLFAPLPNTENLQLLGDALIKLLLVEDLEFETERYILQVYKYPILWLEVLIQSLVLLYKLSEALVEKRHRLFKFVKLLLDSREMIDKDVKLPLTLLEKTSAIFKASDQFIELYPVSQEYFDSKDFENLLYKNLNRLFYLSLAKNPSKDVLIILKNYFIFLVSKHGENPKIKKLKRSSWSFESLSRFSLENNQYSLSELYSMICQSLEHENSELRGMAIQVLMGIPLGQIPFMLDSTYEIQEACSESLRNVKYRPLKSSQKADELKVCMTNLQAHLIERLTKEESVKLDDKFIQIVQRHLLEVFYFECEIDIDVSLPNLRLSFYSLIRSLFNLDRSLTRRFSLFPYKLQAELFSHMKEWYTDIQREKQESGAIPRLNQKLETELVSTMFLLCDGLLYPPPSHRHDIIPIQIVFSWIDDVGIFEKYHEKGQKALLDLLQNGAIIEHIIDRCYKHRHQSPIYSKCLEFYSRNESTNLSEELKVKLEVAMISETSK